MSAPGIRRARFGRRRRRRFLQGGAGGGTPLGEGLLKGPFTRLRASSYVSAALK
jgi:hypothetical protein